LWLFRSANTRLLARGGPDPAAWQRICLPQRKAFIEFVKNRPFPAPYETTAVAELTLQSPAAPRPDADQMDHAAPQGLLTPQKFLDRSALVFPDKVAVKFNDQTYTYAELSRA